MASRRAVLMTAGVVCVSGAGVVALGGRNLLYSALTEDFDGATLSAPDAHRLAATGQIVLVDIRRPDEWSASGSAEHALRLDLRRDDFATVLADATGGNRDAPIALICARGVRSARTANALRSAGFTDVMDVPEGMFGSAAGPGWIARGLPLNRAPI